MGVNRRFDRRQGDHSMSDIPYVDLKEGDVILLNESGIKALKEGWKVIDNLENTEFTIIAVCGPFPTYNYFVLPWYCTDEYSKLEGGWNLPNYWIKEQVIKGLEDHEIIL